MSITVAISCRALALLAFVIGQVHDCFGQAGPTKVISADTTWLHDGTVQEYVSLGKWSSLGNRVFSMPFSGTGQLVFRYEGGRLQRDTLIHPAFKSNHWPIDLGLHPKEEYDPYVLQMAEEGYTGSYCSGLVGNAEGLHVVIQTWLPQLDEEGTTSLYGYCGILDVSTGEIEAIDLRDAWSHHCSPMWQKYIWMEKDGQMRTGMFATKPDSLWPAFAYFTQKDGRWKLERVSTSQIPALWKKLGQGYINTTGVTADSLHFFDLAPVVMDISSGDSFPLFQDQPSIDPEACLHSPGKHFVLSDARVFEKVVQLLFTIEDTAYVGVYDPRTRTMVRIIPLGKELNTGSLNFLGASEVLAFTSSGLSAVHWVLE